MSATTSSVRSRIRRQDPGQVSVLTGLHIAHIPLKAIVCEFHSSSAEACTLRSRFGADGHECSSARYCRFSRTRAAISCFKSRRSAWSYEIARSGRRPLMTNRLLVQCLAKLDLTDPVTIALNCFPQWRMHLHISQVQHAACPS